MINFLQVLQIIIAGGLIASILLQQGSQALGSTFGGAGGFYATRRGIQKKIFWATIILGALFIVVSLLNLFR